MYLRRAVLDVPSNFDTNGNGILDPEEGQYAIVGGTDAVTGEAFTAILRAVAGSTVVTPLTTLIAALVDGGATPEVAQTRVKTSLGLPSNVDLSTFDAIASKVEGSSDGLAVLATQVAIQTTIALFSKVIETIAPSLGVDVKTLDID